MKETETPSPSYRTRPRPLYGAAGASLLLLLGLSACENAKLCLNCGEDPLQSGGAAGDAGRPQDASTAGSGKDAGGDSQAGDPDGTGGEPDGGGVGGCDRSAEERCNQLDDDCDGKVDETFDLLRDLRHCGACNATCSADNTSATCSAGKCSLGACQLGYEDLDGEVGCEYRCPIFPTRSEDCNGTDDDCDGAIDEDLGPPPENLCRALAGTPCANVRPTCKTYEDRTFWSCDYGPEVEFDPRVANGIVADESLCDGLDGDCDGEVDEPWDIGGACDDGGHGACQGRLMCDPDDAKKTLCNYDHLQGAGPGATEICNGIDDDCNGVVDDGVVEDLVHVTDDGLDFYIYRYEASRPDATARRSGSRTDRACGRKGVLPWTFVTFDAAHNACSAAGKRLCTADEWRAACRGASATRYPYGIDYDPQRCNGADHGPLVYAAPSALQPTGALAQCQGAADGAFDLSGNVKEWTADQRGVTSDGAPIYVVRGGSFESPERGLTCLTDLSQAAGSPGQEAIGFRCCSDDPD